tara:strand:+ start:1022 stop:1171 length:150 start_codon:yes stop_codon:yes gene_type:complete
MDCRWTDNFTACSLPEAPVGFEDRPVTADTELPLDDISHISHKSIGQAD